MGDIMALSEKFQSTSLVRGTTKVRIKRARDPVISIHVPRERDDAPIASAKKAVHVISIHVPRERDDLSSQR